jgi:hypothetical protein
MNAEQYLDHLSSELKGFPPQEKAALIEEIATHIEEGQTDPHLGHDALERNQKLEAEMGSPHDLGRGLEQVHRPNRWLDFLLVFIPFEVLKYPLLTLLLLFFGNLARTNSSPFSEPYLVTSIRAFFLLYGLMVLIALRRRSLDVLFFWLPQTILIAFTLIFREKRWMLQSPFNAHQAGMIESLLWLILLAGMLSWLAYLLWVNRRNSLLIVLALIPFLITVENMSLVPYISGGQFSGGYWLPDWNLIVIAGFPLGLYQVSVLLWPLLFYVSRQWQIRWVGLLLNAAPLALLNFVASTPYKQLAALWVIPIALVLTGWLIDLLRHAHHPEMTI